MRAERWGCAPRGRSSGSIWRAALRSAASGSAAAPLLPPRRRPPPGVLLLSSSPTAPSSLPLSLPQELASPGSSGLLGDRRRQGDSQLNPGEIPTGLRPDWQLREPVGARGSAPWLLWVCLSAIRNPVLLHFLDPFSTSPSRALFFSIFFSLHFHFFWKKIDEATRDIFSISACEN